MALPVPPPYTNPIPNNPFFSPLNPYVCGPYFPVAIGNGIDLTTSATVPALVNDVSTVLSAGSGITLTTFLGVTTITATGGGGGGGTPATPTVSGTIYGCTEDPNSLYNTYIGKNAGLGTNTLDSGNTAVGVGSLQGIVDGSSNTALGKDSLFNNASGSVNVAIGSLALCSATGSANVAVGFGAGSQLTSGGFNTLLGNYTLNQATTAQCNIAIGINALNSVDVGGCNIAIGASAGTSLTSGDRNVIIGPDVEVVDGSLDCQLSIGADVNAYWLTGDSTLAIKPGAGIIDKNGSCGTAGQVLSSDGANAIEWITGGGGGGSPATPTVTGTLIGYTDGTDTDFNTSLGYCALGVGAGSGAGFANVAVGICAGCAITTAYGNTLIGPGTGIAIDTGNTNTALGIGALSLATSGFANIGIGMCSGCAYTTESGNAVFGGYFGDAGDTNALILADGPGNIKAKFNGTGALSFDGTGYGSAGQFLQSNGSGSKPTWGSAPTPPIATQSVRGIVYGISGDSGFFGGDNVGFGYGALGALSSSSNRNTALGKNALGSLASFVCDNTAVGYGTLPSITFGEQNTAIGGSSFMGVGATLTTGNNNTLIGYDSDVASASSNNSVTLGNALITVIRAAVTSITSLSDARDKTDVTALPVGLDFVNSLNPVKFTWQMRQPNEVKDGTSEAGFIAQELQAAQEEAGADYLNLVYDDNPDKLEASPGKLVPVLVKAIQELSAKVDSLQTELDILKANG